MSQVQPASNPFCSRHIRPGAVPFFFPEGCDRATLVERLQRNHWHGQIVGPHGTGKSTLLAHLRPHLEAVGREILAIVRHQGESRLPATFWQALDAARPAGLVVVDGYEQLGFWSRWQLRSRCRRQGLGLLVTAHTDMGLPDLHRTKATPALALRVVEHLTREAPRLVHDAEVIAQLTRQKGNLREVLFALYDLHERRR